MTALLTSPELKLAWHKTEQVIQVHSKTFLFATSLLPRTKRMAVRSLYAFCRTTDDLIDRQDATLQDLENWRAQVNLPLEQQTDPLIQCWSHVRATFNVNRQYEQELIDGVLMDLLHQNYPTWDALQTYCYHVASTVGLMSIPIIGLAQGVSFERAAPYAIKLGIALQLTNILRDVGEDAQRGRVYLPKDDLSRFHLNVKDILNGVLDDRFTDLMKFEIQRARRLYDEALPGIQLLNPVARPSVGAAAMLYRAILDQIEKIHYQVHTKRAHTTAFGKLLMLPGILFHIYTRKYPE